MRTAVLLPLVISVFASTALAQSSEFSAEGSNVVRIENEAKLKVPQEITEQVWTWLQERYKDSTWLNRDGRTFTSTFGDEIFVDRYFDTPDLKLLGLESGVRHRSRIVTEGSAKRKDGRQLVQVKLSRHDGVGLERSEIKYTVDTPAGVDSANETSVLSLLDRSDRAAMSRRLADIGVDPTQLRPMVTLDQNRRRVYVADQNGPFATVTLDMVSTSGWWQSVAFTEIELELNEIRYTEADEKTRLWMHALNEVIQADLVARFPGIAQDQTPKYNKAFARLETGMPFGLPVRQFIRWHLTATGVLSSVTLVLVGLALFSVARFTGFRRSGSNAARAAY
jgi:hypothetical protein